MHWLVIAVDCHENIIASRWAWSEDDARNIWRELAMLPGCAATAARDMRTI